MKFTWTIYRGIGGLILVLNLGGNGVASELIKHYPFQTAKQAVRRTKYKIICEHRRNRKQQRKQTNLIKTLEKYL